MSIKLNLKAYNHAVRLIENGLEIEHNASHWAEARPTENDKVRFLNTHDVDSFGSWFLGINTDSNQDKDKFVYPFGDLNVIHMGALLETEREAGKHGHHDIAEAAQNLLDLIEDCENC